MEAEQTMDECLEQLRAEFEALAVVFKNILDEPIPEAVKRRLFKPLWPSAFKPQLVKDENPHLSLTKEDLVFFENNVPMHIKLDPDIY